MRTSYSAIQTYLQCPQRYEFQDIKKIRVPKSREALFGTLIHSTLRFMFKQDPLFPTLDEVVGYFREHWPTHEVFNQESKNNNEIKELPLEGIFIEIGWVPNSGIINGLVSLNKKNEIIVDHKTQVSSLPGIWAAGDIADVLYKQNNISMVDAIKAVLNIYDYLKKKKD